MMMLLYQKSRLSTVILFVQFKTIMYSYHRTLYVEILLWYQPNRLHCNSQQEASSNKLSVMKTCMGRKKFTLS